MISIIPIVLALTSTVSGLVPHSGGFARHAMHARKEQPNSQYGDFLEKYDGYHRRYLALNCQDKHNTTFFEQCCHPLLATESVKKNRPKQCQPPPGPFVDKPDIKTPFDDNFKKEPKPKADPPKPKDDKPKKADAGGGGGGGLITGGFATFYTQDGNFGACGNKHKDSDFIAAMNVARYGNTGVHSSLCGKTVKITNVQNKQSVKVIVADACPGCKNSNSIDLSTGAFNQIAKPEEGMVPIEWSFV
jgi:hypothetical protein